MSQSPLEQNYKNRDYLFELRSGLSRWSEGEDGIWSLQEKRVLVSEVKLEKSRQ